MGPWSGLSPELLQPQSTPCYLVEPPPQKVCYTTDAGGDVAKMKLLALQLAHLSDNVWVADLDCLAHQ